MIKISKRIHNRPICYLMHVLINRVAELTAYLIYKKKYYIFTKT